jgi:hypothetical protein
MANETRWRAEDCPPYRYRPEYVRLSLVGLVMQLARRGECAPPRLIRV